MKFYSELSALENVGIDLESTTALLSAVAEAVENMQAKHIQLALWNIEKQLQDLDDRFQVDFQYLWETVKEDEEKEVKKDEKPKKKSKSKKSV